jgi:ATP-dependent DNA helicase RecG
MRTIEKKSSRWTDAPLRAGSGAVSSLAAARLTPDTPVAALAGIGPKRAELLAARGIRTLFDLVLHLPARYQDWRERAAPSSLTPGMTAVVEGDIGEIEERPMRRMRWRRLASGWLVTDGGVRIRLVWFNLPAYMRGRMPAGQRVLVRGRIGDGPDGTLEIAQPEIVALADGEPAPIRPVYRLGGAVAQRLFATLVTRALDAIGDDIAGAIPAPLRAESPAPGEALRQIHNPDSDADIKLLDGGESPAHAALALDELFAFELALARERARSARRAGVALTGPSPIAGRWLGELPFALTGAQRTAIAEIGRDLETTHQMNRLLMGDVGSGKTCVAFWAALRAAECGRQAALMAPTELLAEQHHASFQRLCGRLGVPAALLTGAVTGAARASVLRGLASGALPIVFGTHALLQERVKIRRLAVGIIDEQHRFGVFDRARMKALGADANVLMMTATPIPRSLAMSLFANLDVSFLDEMPPGRALVKTEILTDDELERADSIVRGELARGHRAYYVLPMIESDDDDDEIRSVAAMAVRLKKSAPREFRLATMHGRMHATDKERVMREFRDGAANVLVSTTVVEVGIDVPDATVIVIAGAERYGLAQLHQLRGRVGRGSAPSRCVLIASRDADDAARERLEVLAACASGAEVAREDLRLRGPGDLLGARQTGALPLRFVHLVRDWRLIERARTLADEWLWADPELGRPESAGARLALERLMSYGFSLADVG